MGKFLSLRAQRGNLLHYNQQVKDCRVAIAPRNDQLIRVSLGLYKLLIGIMKSPGLGLHQN
jgi:hypothetical protein